MKKNGSVVMLNKLNPNRKKNYYPNTNNKKYFVILMKFCNYLSQYKSFLPIPGSWWLSAKVSALKLEESGYKTRFHQLCSDLYAPGDLKSDVGNQTPLVRVAWKLEKGCSSSAILII
ncbi:hypothetical protein AVEN_195368-1 [Araneus ventricosus]|uniref:Uncharacterized protein n=1 Tax=Araneus ventricosus TaxID=182803 RepID=A0A4Y2DKV2_ARAVE|nr:hypothetical protein AVEN_195368-1 [Araneus ventricosus]